MIHNSVMLSQFPPIVVISPGYFGFGYELSMLAIMGKHGMIVKWRIIQFLTSTMQYACLCGAMRSASACTILLRVFAPRLCHRGQTHRFSRCLSVAAGALEYPKKNSRNGNKEELYFNFTNFTVHVYNDTVATLRQTRWQSNFLKIISTSKYTSRELDSCWAKDAVLGKRHRVHFAAVLSQPGVVCSEKVTFDPLTRWPFQKRTPQGQFRGPPTYTHQVWRRSAKGPRRSRGTNKRTNAARIIVWFPLKFRDCQVNKTGWHTSWRESASHQCMIWEVSQRDQGVVNTSHLSSHYCEILHHHQGASCNWLVMIDKIDAPFVGGHICGKFCLLKKVIFCNFLVNVVCQNYLFSIAMWQQ